jgi:hypothetical protein
VAVTVREPVAAVAMNHRIPVVALKRLAHPFSSRSAVNRAM